MDTVARTLSAIRLIPTLLLAGAIQSAANAESPSANTQQQAVTTSIYYQEEVWSNGLRVIRLDDQLASATESDGAKLSVAAEIEAAINSARQQESYIERRLFSFNGDCEQCLTYSETLYDQHARPWRMEQAWADNSREINEYNRPDSPDVEAAIIRQEYYKDDHWLGTVRYSGNADNNLLLESSAPGETQTWQYDEQGRITEHSRQDTLIASAVRTTRFAYQGEHLTAIDGPRIDVDDRVELAYDQHGNLTAVTNSIGHTTRFEYDSEGRRTAATDINGLRTEYSYNSSGQITSIVRGAGTVTPTTTRYGYDDSGRLIELLLPRGQTVNRFYDSEGRLTRLQDGNGNRADFQYDAQGRLAERAVYDHQQQSLVQLSQRAVEHLDGLADTPGQQTEPDNSGPAIDGNSNYEYDQYQRLVKSVDALGGITRYDYNDRSQLISYTDAGGATTGYEYNGFGETISQHSPATGSSTYKYDEAGNIIREEYTNGIVIRRHFDALNRPVRIVFRQAGEQKKVLRYRYDDCANGLGRLCRVSESKTETGADSAERSRTAYQYDLFGNFSRIKTVVDGQTQVTRYQYNAQNQLQTLVYPSGLKVTYHYSTSGAAKQVTAEFDGKQYIVATDIQYRPLQNGIQQLTWGNGLTSQHQYSLDGQLAGITTGAGSHKVQQVSYQYDGYGNITVIEKPLSLTPIQRYYYDQRQQLIEEVRAESIKTYGYDAVGNRLSLTSSDSANKNYQYASGSNRLERINRKALSYDDVGNLIEDRNGKRRFSYDATNRLTEFHKNGELRASYTYNAFGQRIKKTIQRKLDDNDDHRTLLFNYLPEGWLLSESGYGAEGNKAFTRDYIWLGGKPLAQIHSRYRKNDPTKIKNQEITYLHTDHLNTPRLATDTQQRIVWRWESDAFGVGSAERDPDGNGKKVTVRLRFPGQYYDSESKLHYNHHRDYDPKLGRYIQSDPLGLADGPNTYLYVKANPLVGIDPTGLFMLSTPGAACFPTLPLRRGYRYDPTVFCPANRPYGGVEDDSNCDAQGGAWYDRVNWGDAAFATGGIVLSGLEFAGGAVLTIVSGAATTTGVGTGPGVAGIYGGLAITGHGAYGVFNSWQDLKNAVDGGNRGGAIQQTAEFFYGQGSSQARAGRTLDNILTISSGIRSVTRAHQGSGGIGDAHGILSMGRLLDQQAQDAANCRIR